MMTDPITPPSELLDHWCMDATLGNWRDIATQSAQWGADQELEACVAWLEQLEPPREYLAMQLRAARRPKPPSRKEQALEAIGRLCASVIHDDLKNDAAIVRRALEALDD